MKPQWGTITACLGLMLIITCLFFMINADSCKKEIDPGPTELVKDSIY